MRNWVERAAALKFDEGVSWTKLPEILSKEFGEEFTVSRVRAALRRHPRYGVDKPVIEGDLNDLVLKAAEKGTPREKVLESLNISDRILDAAINDLQDYGYLVVDEDGVIKLSKLVVPTENVYDVDWRGDRIIRFGLVGDTQFNSKYTQITYLHDFYDICKAEGITKVFHTGDMDEGEEMRIGHKYECYTQGADDHVQEIVTNYPKREGIITEFITGNHDHSIIRRCGYDIGQAIARERDDMVYLGRDSAKVNLTPNCSIELRHPGDGSAYALSYKPQKMVDAMSGGEKPNILAIGHYHKAEYLFYRNVHIFQTGCFQAQTGFMKSRGLAAMIGGWLVEIHVDGGGTITRCKGEFIPYYEAIKDDWKNWR